MPGLTSSHHQTIGHCVELGWARITLAPGIKIDAVGDGYGFVQVADLGGVNRLTAAPVAVPMIAFTVPALDEVAPFLANTGEGDGPDDGFWQVYAAQKPRQEQTIYLNPAHLAAIEPLAEDVVKELSDTRLNPFLYVEGMSRDTELGWFLTPEQAAQLQRYDLLISCSPWTEAMETLVTNLPKKGDANV